MAKKPPTDLNPTLDLGDFDGMPVAEVAIKITKTGDGLSKAMNVEPIVLAVGDEVTMIVRGKVSAIGFAPIKKDVDVLARVQTIEASLATFVDPALGDEVLARHAELLEEAAGRPKQAALTDGGRNAEDDDLEDDWDAGPLRPVSDTETSE